jgi:hypothetical protein|tara:strand:- start:2290 stop:2493 length:204 start_codon:yes stop_codon:yes gene_type:complete
MLKIKITNFLLRYLFNKKHITHTAITDIKAQNKIIIFFIILSKELIKVAKLTGSSLNNILVLTKKNF